tara:strand:+ start:1012 stop:1800 length:789 start_codon:yes stop_codon:yes gene_type:complete
MRGYGDHEIGGLGFGDPESLAGVVLELGYGSPNQEASVYLELRSSKVHHRGGAKVQVTGSLSPSLSPFRLSIQINGVLTYLYSGIPGQGPNLLKRRGDLEAYTPPAPSGTYTMTLHCGPNFSQSYSIATPLLIVPDNRGDERFFACRLPPSFYQTGARFNALKNVDLASSKPTRPSYLHMILDIFGRISQEHAGSPQTVLSRDHARGETDLSTESTLSFPANGIVSIEGRRYNYSHSGSQIILSDGLKRNLPKLSKVVLYAP